VPIPPVLVAMPGEWVEQNNLTDAHHLLFRTRNDTRPSGSNWIRAWRRALNSVGQKPLRVYDLPSRSGDHMVPRRDAPRRDRATARAQRGAPD
jgi:hypothetical protein